jgi:four helix bundle protein
MPDAVRRFEDLIAWQKARELTRLVYVATRNREFARDFGLCSQIQRSAVSVMANIAEGFDRKRNGEFHQYLSIAKASCAEVRSHLYVALDIGYLTEEQFSQLMNVVQETGRVVSGLRSSAERNLSTQNLEPRTSR